MASPEVQIDVALETKKARQELEKLNTSINKMSSNAQKKVRRTDNAIASFKGNLAATAVSAGFSLIRKGFDELVIGAVKAAAETEKLKTQFEVLTGSQEKASSLFAELTKFSASTPFQLNNIAEASAQLLSFGFASEGVTERIKNIGEVAAGSNSDLKDVALIYGQVSAAGKLTGERLLQLQERAVPIGAALAKSLGVAESEVKDLVSSGVVGFKEFEQAFNSMSSAGGIFEGAIDKQSKTINGSLSTLSDNFEILKTSIGELASPIVLAGITSLTSIIQGFNRAVTGGTASEKLQDLSNQIIQLRSNLKDTGKLEIISRNSGQSVEKVTASINKQILALQSRAQELAKGQKTEGPAITDGRTEKEEAANKQIAESRAKLKQELALIEAEAKIKAQEVKVADKDINSEERAIELEKLLEFENKKSAIVTEFELQKNTKIRDSESKKLADKVAFGKQDLAVQLSLNKQKKALDDQQLADKQAFFGAATSLASSENKTLAAIGKAAGLLQIAQATPPAIASSYNFGARIGGPFLGATFGGIAFAAQAAQAANMAKFANGGFITSGTNTGDSGQVSVNRNEAILNSRQQNEFMRVANGNGGSSGELNEKIDELIAVMSSQPVNVMIDGREVFKAVREQQLARGA